MSEAPSPPTSTPADARSCMIDMMCPTCRKKYGAAWRSGQPLPPCPTCGWVPPASSGEGLGKTIAQMEAERQAKKAAGQKAPSHPDAPPFLFFKPGTCRSCSAPIWWAKTDKGGDAPLDRKPIQSMFVDVDRGLVYARKSFQNHFATCPHAQQHRTKP